MHVLILSTFFPIPSNFLLMHKEHLTTISSYWRSMRELVWTHRIVQTVGSANGTPSGMGASTLDVTAVAATTQTSPHLLCRVALHSLLALLFLRSHRILLCALSPWLHCALDRPLARAFCTSHRCVCGHLSTSLQLAADSDPCPLIHHWHNERRCSHL